MRRLPAVVSVVLLAVIAALAALAGCVEGGEPREWESPEVYGDDDDATEDEVLATAIALADTWTAYHDPASLAWSWDAAVLMMGLMDLSRVTGEASYADYALAWLDHHIDAGYTIASSDSAVPAYVALLAWRATGDDRYLAVGDDAWDYIENKAGRTSDGGLNHLGWISGNELWIDSLFMVGPFLMDYADATGDDAPAREYAKQLNIFRRHLRDDATGLYRHQYDDDTGEVAPAEALFWGRGNGWVFAAQNIAATRLPDSARADLEFDLEADLDAMRASIVSMTPRDGRFHTIVNEAASYRETSAGLLFAYGLATAVRDGRTDRAASIDWIERWIAGAMREIAEDAAQDTLLLGVSYGTSPGDLAYYNQVMKGENVSYGIGAFLLAAVAREDIGPERALARPSVRKADETYVEHPIPCEGSTCGKFHLARGNFDRAKGSFAEALASNGADSEALFYDALVDTVRVGVGVVQQLDKEYVGEIDMDGVIAWLAAQRPALQSVSARMAGAEANAEFSSRLERLLIIESGGHNAVGEREYDLGEAFLVDAVAHVLSGGLALLGGGEKSFTLPHGAAGWIAAIRDAHRAFAARATKSEADDAIDEIISGIDDLVAGINAIMAEIDDQSDDLIPKNLLKLEGTFGIPGILPETDVKELVAGLGLPADLLANLDMPEALIDLLETIRAVLEAVKLIV